MQKFQNKTRQRFYSLSPRTGNSQKNLHLNNIYNIGNINQYYPMDNYNNISSNIFLLYSPKNININNARVRNIYSPIGKNLSLKKSSSQRNINFNRPLSHTPQNTNFLYSFSYTKKQPVYKKKVHYNLEKEKLYQETYQIRKIVNFLNKKLSKIKMENFQKDEQIKQRQQKINDIILNNNNDSTFFENKNNNNIHNKRKINFKNNLQIFNSSNNSSFNELSFNSSTNNNNNLEDFFSNKKSGAYNLLKKIKKSIDQMNDFISVEKKRYEGIKKSLFLTKLNELNIESTLLEEQINKINTFIQRDILIQEENQKKKENLNNLQLNIERQEKIIKSLNERSNYLEKEEERLKYILNETKKKLETKEKEINKNKAKLNSLIKKNNILSKNKDLTEQKDFLNAKNTNIIDYNSINIPSVLKTYYKNEISKINKIIKFYAAQCDFTEKEIAKLKNQQIKMGSGVGASGKNDEESLKLVISNFQNDIIKKSFGLNDKEKMKNIKKTLKETNEEKEKLKKKLDIYQNKLSELEKNNEKDGDDFYNKSQIEFGIDENNPFYSSDEDNNPEKTGKFSSVQFNQFTYILFKNFESRDISFDESQEKLIKLFLDFNQKNKIFYNPNEKINYQSKKFNLITEGYSKIIMDVLNRNNPYNFSMTKIFMKALFYNSECDLNRLMEYFKVLFSYTRNHSIEEENYLNKLRTTCKDLTVKLISCVKEFMAKSNSKNKKYIDLIEMKNLFDIKKIDFEDEYIEFIFYYMKKFEDPQSKLSDLKLSLLYNIMDYTEYNDFENSEININSREENNLNNDINIDINKNEKKINKQIQQNLEQKNNNSINNSINEENKEKIEEKKNKGKKEIKGKKENQLEKLSRELAEPQEIIKSATENNINPKINNIPNEFQIGRAKNFENEKEDADDNSDEDSMTEITNEEYVKQLLESIKQMREGLEKTKTDFNDLMSNIIQKRKINGKFYEYVTIEDFNEQFKTIGVNLSDLKLSCLCSKYSIPNELRLMDKNKINSDIQKYIKGELKFEEEDNI